MKKHLLSLIAVAFLAIGITACSNAKSTDESKGEKTENKDDLKDPESVVTTLVDLLNDCTRKVNAVSDEEEYEAAGKSIEDTFAEFKDDDKELSADEKSEVVAALADLVAALGCKQAELEGQILDSNTQAIVKSQSKTAVESICKDCKSIKDIIVAFAAFG
jgi:lipoprotein